MIVFSVCIVVVLEVGIVLVGLEFDDEDCLVLE